MFGKQCNEEESDFRKEGRLKAPKKYKAFAQRLYHTRVLSFLSGNFNYM